LRYQGFQHPVLEGLDIWLKEIKKDGKNAVEKILEREISFNTRLFHQTITCVTVAGQNALAIHFHDMTEIKAVQEKARLMEAVIVNANDSVIITTGDLEENGPEIIYVNDAFTRMTGYLPHEVIGKSPRILQGSGTNVRTLKLLKDTLKSGKPFQGELLNYSKDGKSYWLDIGIVPVHNEKGEITHYAAIERDITQRKAFEKEMQINREAAEVANRAKGDFLANMSHELRTPMNGIIGLSELLMEMNMSEEQEELCDAINSSSRNLLILLNDILDLSKIEANELTLEHVPFDLRHVVRQSIDLLRPMASRKGVTLDNSINPIVPERIIGDPIRLQQIMNNLISNAIKFTEVGYIRLDISSSKDKNGSSILHMRVEDSGIGISEDYKDTIFNKFTQGDVSTARKYGGTGLGLSITKELVEMMNGEIHFDSVEGKGTTFYADIPVEVTKEAENSGSSDSAKTLQHFNTKARILVVDDHPVNLLFIRKVLKKLGFENADEARSGSEALQAIQNKTYDLVFMDCQMPEMDGFEASIAIRDLEGSKIGSLPIIAVTADAMKGAREKCIDAGMNDYISKPVDLEKLKAVLGEWVSMTSGEPALEQKPELSKDKNDFVSLSLTDSLKSIPMNWERLSMFTDDDPEEELALIALFQTYAAESLQSLKTAYLQNDDDMWKKAAHKLKGSAANFGADHLSAVCLEAESFFQPSADQKDRMLEVIMKTYYELDKILETRLPQKIDA
jgi:PAS domain S-box-containing protein